MTTANGTTAAAQTAPVSKLQRTSTITLGASDKSLMQIVAERKPDGSAKTYVVTTDADKKSARGMTESHSDLEVAKQLINSLAEKAEKLGWVRRSAGRAFVAKPDAFASLPAAPKARK